MKRQEIIDKLAAHRAEIYEMAIESLFLFGSVARDAATFKKKKPCMSRSITLVSLHYEN